MFVVPKKDDAAVVRQIDAESRVAVWAANHFNSPLISKLGLTHIGDGAADASGKIILHDNGPGLTLERRDAVTPQGQLPYQDGMLPTTAQAPQQMGYVPAQLAIPQLSLVSPHEISQIISKITEGCDPVYTAGKLGLLTRKMDKISGPKFGRAFCEPQVPVASLFNMECRDADAPRYSGYPSLRVSSYTARSPPINLGRVRAPSTMALPMRSCARRTGTATLRRCIPISVPPISSPASARMLSSATG